MRDTLLNPAKQEIAACELDRRLPSNRECEEIVALEVHLLLPAQDPGASPFASGLFFGV